MVLVKQKVVFRLKLEEDKAGKELIAEKKFLKLNADTQTATNVNFNNLLLESDTYFSLLTTLSGNPNVESFKMDNVEVNSSDSKRKILK